MVVENVLDTEEIVVKPLGKQVKDIAVFAGATIMGDGNVALILDVLGLAQRAQGRVRTTRRLCRRTRQRETMDRSIGHQTLLLFESAAGQRMALPLSRVTRLEKFPLTDIERSGPCDVGAVLGPGHAADPSVASAYLAAETAHRQPTRSTPQQDTLEVVVLTMQSRSIGLVVDRILDTVEDVFDIQPLQESRGRDWYGRGPGASHRVAGPG